MMRRLLASTLGLLLMVSAQAQSDLPFNIESVTTFNEPWAMAFLPDGRMLVTEKKGNLYIVNQDGQKTRSLRGVPDVFTAARVAWAMSPCIRISRTTAGLLELR